MAQFNLGDLVKQGQEHEGNDYDADYMPKAGDKLAVQVVRANAKENSDGTPGFGIWLEVMKGDDKGNRFWMNLNFSAKWGFINQRTVANFEGLGISASYLSGDPSPEEVVAALEGKRAICVVKYSKNKENPDRPWENHTLTPVKSTAPPPPPAEEPEDDDDDDNWDED